MRPFFSIIIASYNAEKTLEQAILSVLSQSNQNYQLIIIDGGSKDNTVEIIKNYQHDISYWCSESDRGIYDAFNKGIKQSKGEWVYFLGADDLLYDETVLDGAEPILRNLCADNYSFSNTYIAYGNIQYMNAKHVPLFNLGGEWQKIKNNHLQMMTIPHQGIFHQRDVFQKWGLFDLNYKVAGDYELLLRVLKESEPFYMKELAIARVNIEGTSNKYHNRLMTLKEFLAARNKNQVKGFPHKLYWNIFKVTLGTKLAQWLGPQIFATLKDLYRKVSGRRAIWVKYLEK